MITADDLQAVELLADLEPAGLEWLAEQLEELRLEPGDLLHEPGSPAEWLYITLEGSLQGTVRKDGRDVGTFVYEPGDVGGMLPHSRMTVFPALTKAVEPSRVAQLHVDQFPEMLERLPGLEIRLAHLMADRIR
ncbi:MAG: Crp/Fnr family transcriptional regulator, partial [Acidobacteriota bacterium]|nr:Crp/Fnr family transcriptional regulator [Acidobacteriota bacterium]